MVDTFAHQCAVHKGAITPTETLRPLRHCAGLPYCHMTCGNVMSL